MTDLDLSFGPPTQISRSEGSPAEGDLSSIQTAGASAGAVWPIGQKWPFPGLAEAVAFDISRSNRPMARCPSAATTDRTILMPPPPSAGRSLQDGDHRSGIGDGRDFGDIFDLDPLVEEPVEDFSSSSSLPPGPSRRAETTVPAQYPSFFDRRGSAQRVSGGSRGRDEPLERFSRSTSRRNGQRAAGALNDPEDRSRIETSAIDAHSARSRIPARGPHPQSEPDYDGGDGVNTDTPRLALEISRSRRQQPHEEFANIEHRARFVTSQARPRRLPSRHIPWSKAENKALLEGISSHGCAWANIKNCDVVGTLRCRSQIALKDRARNMKVNYLM